MPFSDNHKRLLLTSFSHMDKLLAQAAANLEPTEGNRLFPPCVPDATPIQRRVIGDYIGSFRNVARPFLESAAVTAQGPTTSGLWMFRTALDFVWITLAEMEPKRMAGYGALDPDASAEVEKVLAQLHAIVRQVSEYLQIGLGGDLRDRLARLDQTRDEVALLSQLERIVSDYGLVEFRATIAWILQRFERPWLEVAFFGRVSCGKSSLLNALLGREVLPTGVTPVTAVPTRIVPADSASATVAFARAPSRRIELDQLAEFASEDRNPGNEKRVVDIVVELPAPLLKAGVCLVDTPGLGSLATEGAAESLAYLPRCDIGVLLIDASGALHPDDISVAHAILESGAILIPGLSKADLLGPADLQKMADYVRVQLQTALGLDIRISPVSVAAQPLHPALSWFQRELSPRLEHRRSLLSASLRRKVGALRESVSAALAVRAHHDRPDDRSPSAHADVSAALADARGALVGCRERAARVVERMVDLRLSALDATAQAVADFWAGKPDLDGSHAQSVEQYAALCLAREVNRFGDELGSVVEEARLALEKGLASAAETLPSPIEGIDHLDGLDGRPLFDPEHLFRGIGLRPGLWRRFGRAAGKASANRRLLKAMGTSLARSLEAHAGALKRWALDGMTSLEKAFDASAAVFSALDPGRAGSGPTEEARTHLAADLQLLSQWNGAASA